MIADAEAEEEKLVKASNKNIRFFNLHVGQHCGFKGYGEGNN